MSKFAAKMTATATVAPLALASLGNAPSNRIEPFLSSVFPGRG